jgi:hypothetical protein
MNDTHELLFLVATQFLELNYMQKLNIGMRLKLIDFSSLAKDEKTIDDMVFANAYKNGMIAKLVVEIEKIKHGK